MMRMMACVVAILAMTASACAVKQAEGSVSSSDEACELVAKAVIARGDYRAEQIAGCNGDLQDDDDSRAGYYILRLNAHCREDICGSVLLGWYAIEQSTGRVYEWDVAEWRLGEEVLPSE